MGYLKDFKEFASKGNVVDLAVGLVIGAAFGKIVSSFVSDVLMPPIGALLGGVNFTDFKFTLKEAAEGAVAVTINYGNFIQTVFDFLIIAFAIFWVVKVMNKMKKQEIDAPAALPAPSNEEVLLGEIRDLLKKK
ncbi:MAG: large-conductance mechanosensitive channel protein MscL [Flavobacteriaceae bacterium]|nr:large-conductance mechanosensitive channel protein MscL [Flavobacteriaceae bacterium]